MLIFAFDFRFHLLAVYATSIDPELRDTFGYEILSTWIHRSGKFSAADLDSLRRQFIPYAREGLGEVNECDLLGYAGVHPPALAALIARQKNPAVPATLRG